MLIFHPADGSCNGPFMTGCDEFWGGDERHTAKILNKNGVGATDSTR